jgi:hypothetical protein
MDKQSKGIEKARYRISQKTANFNSSRNQKIDYNMNCEE